MDGFTPIIVIEGFLGFGVVFLIYWMHRREMKSLAKQKAQGPAPMNPLVATRDAARSESNRHMPPSSRHWRRKPTHQQPRCLALSLLVRMGHPQGHPLPICPLPPSLPPRRLLAALQGPNHPEDILLGSSGGRRSMAGPELPMLKTWVRFPSPAPISPDQGAIPRPCGRLQTAVHFALLFLFCCPMR